MLKSAAEGTGQPSRPVTLVFVPRFVVRATEGGHAALVLAWLVAHNKEAPDAPGPTPDDKRLQTELALSRRQVDAAMKRLVTKKLIEPFAGEDQPSKGALRIVLHKRFLRRMKREGRRPKGNAVPLVAIRLTKTANQSLLLAAICRWFEPDGEAITKFRSYQNGKWWRANCPAQLRRETGLSKTQVDRALRGLKSLGLIATDSFHVPGKAGQSKKKLHVRPNMEQAAEVIDALPRRRRPDPPLRKRPQTKYKKPKDKPWLNVEQQWEEDLVAYLLDRYGLSDTKTKGYLLKLAKVQDPTGPNRLTLAAFHELFPAYPLSLYPYRMSAKDCEGLTVPKFFLNLDKTVFIKAIGHTMGGDVRTAHLDGEQFTLEALWAHFQCAPSAIILKWPRLPLEEQFVVRNWLWYPENVEGSHITWTGKGFKFVLEPLWMTLGAVDDKLDSEQQWKGTALYEDCLQPVEPRQ